MKIAEGYLLEKIADSYVLIPVGQNVVDYKKMIHFNETGYYIASQLGQDISYDELLGRLAEHYEAEEDEMDILRKDLDKFLRDMQNKGLLIK